MLERLGYQVDAFHDPKAALADFRARPSHWVLVITDFARQVWAARRDIPIVLYTGFGGIIWLDTAQEMGFAHLLNKPFTYEEIAATVAATLPRQQ